MHGRVLRIDCASGVVSEFPVGEADARKFYLGSGLCAKLMLEWPGIDRMDPCAPEAPLIFMAGLFCGGPLPASPKLSVCAKQTATGVWNEATVGWPADLRRTGIDGMVLTGRAPKPVMLLVTEEGVELRDASALWGKDTHETDALLRAELGPGWRFAMIGQAGENRVAFSSILFDPPNYRVAARGGIGAVMGSKNVKAIAVRAGRKMLPIADRPLMASLLREQVPKIREFTLGLHNFGTSGGVEAVEMFGDLPIKNWQLGSWKEQAKKIAGQTMQPKYLHAHYACNACPIRCAKIYKIPGGDHIGHGPEYESIAMLGANCLNDDPEYLVQANHACDVYGMDVMSTGHSIAFAIEAFERGILTEKDTGGLKLEWGGPTVVKLIPLIARREGIGDLLAHGVRKAAEIIGKGAKEMAVEVKGLEIAGHDPRGHVSMSLSYATAARGGCHLEGLTYFLDRGVTAPDFGYMTPLDPHVSDDKPPVVFTMQNYLSVFNPLGLCKFLFPGRVGPKIVATWQKAVCGWDSDMDEVMAAGERIFNLKRLFNVRQGISRKDDVLPPRMAVGKPDGKAKGVVADLAGMLPKYYELRGWNDMGIPTRERLEKLGIASYAP